MAITLNTTLKNTLLDGLDSTFNSGTLTIYTGTPPGAGNAATGLVLSTITLPADAFAAASGGTKNAQGTWQDTSADSTGTAGYFRMAYLGNILEGTCTATGGGGDLTLDNINIAAGQQVTVTSFTLSSTN
jgi:hypothetical protein